MPTAYYLVKDSNGLWHWAQPHLHNAREKLCTLCGGHEGGHGWQELRPQEQGEAIVPTDLCAPCGLRKAQTDSQRQAAELEQTPLRLSDLAKYVCYEQAEQALEQVQHRLVGTGFLSDPDRFKVLEQLRAQITADKQTLREIALRDLQNLS